MGAKLDVKGIVGKYKELKAKSGGANFDRLQPGENRRRLVTFTDAEGNEQLYVEFFQHFLNNQSFLCLQMNKETCPVCEAHQIAKDAGDEKLSRELRKSKRYYLNVVANGEVKVLECGPQLFKEITSYFADEEYGNIADPKEGYDLRITKEGAGRDTEYKARAAKQPTPVGQFTGEPKDLTALISTFKSAEEIQAIVDKAMAGMVNGGDESDGGDDGDDTAPESGGDDTDDFGDPKPKPQAAKKPASAAKKPAPAKKAGKK